MQTRHLQSNPSRRQAKARLRGLLVARDHPQLLQWAANDSGVMSLLTSMLFEPDELIVWRAVEGIGKTAGLRAESDPESVRDLVRRFIWAMNDESGNLIWRAPEAIGETLANVTSLIREYGTILASYLREEPFERGVHWAIARIGRLAPAAIAESQGELVRSLSLADPYLRAHAGIALASLGAKAPAQGLHRLSNDPAPVIVYDLPSGLLRTSTVGLEVRRALSQSGAADSDTIGDRSQAGVATEPLLRGLDSIQDSHVSSGPLVTQITGGYEVMVKSKREVKKKKPAVAKTEFALDIADATAVYLVGDFNQWGTEEVRMKKDKKGIWRAKVKLDPGIHQYKFLVDGRWIEDPSNPNTTGDPFGGRNSVISVD